MYIILGICGFVFLSCIIAACIFYNSRERKKVEEETADIIRESHVQLQQIDSSAFGTAKPPADDDKRGVAPEKNFDPFAKKKERMDAVQK